MNKMNNIRKYLKNEGIYLNLHAVIWVAMNYIS